MSGIAPISLLTEDVLVGLSRSARREEAWHRSSITARSTNSVRGFTGRFPPESPTGFRCAGEGPIGGRHSSRRVAWRTGGCPSILPQGAEKLTGRAQSSSGLFQLCKCAAVARQGFGHGRGEGDLHLTPYGMGFRAQRNRSSHGCQRGFGQGIHP
jgi:hypothetical protein